MDKELVLSLTWSLLESAERIGSVLCHLPIPASVQGSIDDVKGAVDKAKRAVRDELDRM